MSEKITVQFNAITELEIGVFKSKVYDMITRLTEHQRFLDNSAPKNRDGLSYIYSPESTTRELKKHLDELLPKLEYGELMHKQDDDNEI